MPDDVVLRVVTGREARPVTGGDTSIFSAPADLFIETGQGLALDVARAGRLLRSTSEEQASDLRVALHHAEWRLTVDPATVSSFGIMPAHDQCAGCAEAIATALNMLRLDGEPLFVGRLYWTERLR